MLLWWYFFPSFFSSSSSYFSSSSFFTLCMYACDMYHEWMNECTHSYIQDRKKNSVKFERKHYPTKWQSRKLAETSCIMNTLPVYLLNWSSLNWKLLSPARVFISRSFPIQDFDSNYGMKRMNKVKKNCMGRTFGVLLKKKYVLKYAFF